MAYSSLVILSTLQEHCSVRKEVKKGFSLSLASKAVFVVHYFASLTLLFLIKLMTIYKVRSQALSQASVGLPRGMLG